MDFTELRARVKASEGWALRRELLSLQRSQRLFAANRRELDGFLEAHREGPAANELWRVDNREGFELFLDEVDRLLHNYLASASTLIDHGRIMRKHAPEELRAEYDRRVSEAFAMSPLACFVKDLRNFTTHRRLPVATGTLTWRQGMTWPISTIVLHRDELATWPKWTSQARAFLANAEAEVSLLEVIGAYTAIVDEFNTWLVGAYTSAHAAALDEVQRLEREYAEAYTRATAHIERKPPPMPPRRD